MDHSLNPPGAVAPSPGSNRALRFVIVLGLVIAAIVGLQSYRGYQQRQRDYRIETQSTQAVGKVIVTAFAKQNALKVRTLTGVVQSVSSTTGGPGQMLRADKVVKQPFSVDYFVDMSRLSLEDYGWDARSHTLQVRAPDVTVAAPNIDHSRVTVNATRGVFVTRDMMDSLDRQIAGNAAGQARAEAAKPENMAQAQAAAGEAIAANLAAPLAAAGLGPVKVEMIAKAPRDVSQRDPRWDVSRSIAEVLKQQAARN
jgi:Protein of unknown function (DUF4230)